MTTPNVGSDHFSQAGNLMNTDKRKMFELKLIDKFDAVHNGFI